MPCRFACLLKCLKTFVRRLRNICIFSSSVIGAKNTTEAVVLNSYAKYTHTNHSFISGTGRKIN